MDFNRYFAKQLLVILVSMIFLSGCTGGDKGASEYLVAAMDSEPKNLNPFLSTDANSQYIGQLIFSSLVMIGKDLSVQGDLAETFETDDFQTFKFRLRTPTKFHDGRPLTIQDVVRSIDAYRSKTPENPVYFEAFKKIVSVKATSDKDLVVTLNAPFIGFLTDLPLLKIVPEKVETRSLVGSGPYRVIEQSSFGMKLEANQDYYGPKPGHNKLWVKYIADENTRYMNLLAGDVDIVLGGLSSQRFKTAEANSKLVAHSVPGINYNYLIFNFSQKKFSDVRVRRAIEVGFDAENIIQHKLLGAAKRAASMFSSASPFYPAITPVPYNPAVAQQLMDQAGFTDPDGSGPIPRMNIEIKCSTNKEPTEIVGLIASDLGKVGIQAIARPMEPNAFLEALRSGDFEIAYGQWVGVTSPMMLYEVFHSSQFPPQRNRGRFANNQIDTQLLRLRAAKSQQEVANLAVEIQKLLADQLPYVSLWHPTIKAVTGKGIKNFEVWPNGSWRALIPVQKELVP